MRCGIYLNVMAFYLIMCSENFRMRVFGGVERRKCEEGEEGREKEERCSNGFIGMGYVKFVGKGSSFFQVKRGA